MPHQVTVLTLPEDSAHVGIMLPNGRLVEVRLTREESTTDGADPRLVIRVEGDDHHHVALQFDETVTWAAST